MRQEKSGAWKDLGDIGAAFCLASCGHFQQTRLRS